MPHLSSILLVHLAVIGLILPQCANASCFDNLKHPRLLGSTSKDGDSFYYSVTGVNDILFLGGYTDSPNLIGDGLITAKTKVAVITRMNVALNTVEFSNIYWPGDALVTMNVITALALKKNEPNPT